MRENDSVWVVVHMAHSQKQAQSIRELLEGEGFLVRLRPAESGSAMAQAYIEILALKSEAREARDVLQENGL